MFFSSYPEWWWYSHRAILHSNNRVIIQGRLMNNHYLAIPSNRIIQKKWIHYLFSSIKGKMRRGIVLGNKKYSLTKSVPKRHLQLYRILFVVKHSEYSNSCYPFCPVIIRKRIMMNLYVLSFEIITDRK